jgi:hypothetical protein
VRPSPPADGSLVLGHVVRLSPLQAVLAITVVDGVPLPPGEDFHGVIRVQDVRATEKDKVKIADCFRGGDVVKGQVVCVTSWFMGLRWVFSRSLWEMHETTTWLLLAMTLVWSLRRAKPVGVLTWAIDPI